MSNKLFPKEVKPVQHWTCQLIFPLKYVNMVQYEPLQIPSVIELDRAECQRGELDAGQILSGGFDVADKGVGKKFQESLAGKISSD